MNIQYTGKQPFFGTLVDIKDIVNEPNNLDILLDRINSNLEDTISRFKGVGVETVICTMTVKRFDILGDKADSLEIRASVSSGNIGVAIITLPFMIFENCLEKREENFKYVETGVRKIIDNLSLKKMWKPLPIITEDYLESSEKYIKIEGQRQ